MKAQIEITDTFCGEANYCWAKRFEIEADNLSELQVIRRLKKAAGLENVRWRKVIDCGDFSRYDIVGACICAFITYHE